MSFGVNDRPAEYPFVAPKPKGRKLPTYAPYAAASVGVVVVVGALIWYFRRRTAVAQVIETKQIDCSRRGINPTFCGEMMEQNLDPGSLTLEDGVEKIRFALGKGCEVRACKPDPVTGGYACEKCPSDRPDLVKMVEEWCCPRGIQP